ncbi:MAG: twin transmembrane helix small protein [Hyphomicrobiaceae bacterium]
MQTALYHLTTVAVFAVLIVLVLGLWGLMRNKSASLSQTLMRWRVGLQFFAILVIVVYLLAKA